MQQGKEHEADGGEERPSLLDHQELPQFRHRVQLDHHPGARIGHDDGRDHDFVGRDGDDVGQQDHAVQTDGPPHGFQPLRNPYRQALTPGVDVAQQPDRAAGRHGHDHRAPEDEYRPVYERGVQHAKNAGTPVGRKFQRETAGFAPQEGPGQDGRYQQGRRGADQDDQDQGPGRGHGREGRREGRRHEEGGQNDQRRPPAVAGHEIIGEDGDESLPRRIDDPAGHDPGRVATQAHTHGERLLAVGARLLEQRVDVERHAGKVPQVLQNGENGEEYRHRRKHNGDHPGQSPVDAVPDEPGDPPGHAKRFE